MRQFLEFSVDDIRTGFPDFIQNSGCGSDPSNNDLLTAIISERLIDSWFIAANSFSTVAREATSVNFTEQALKSRNHWVTQADVQILYRHAINTSVSILIRLEQMERTKGYLPGKFFEYINPTEVQT